MNFWGLNTLEISFSCKVQNWCSWLMSGSFLSSGDVPSLFHQCFCFFNSWLSRALCYLSHIRDGGWWSCMKPMTRPESGIQQFPSWPHLTVRLLWALQKKSFSWWKNLSNPGKTFNFCALADVWYSTLKQFSIGSIPVDI